MTHEGVPAPIGIPGAENVYRRAEDLDPAVLYERRELLQSRRDTEEKVYHSAWNNIELAINNPARHTWQVDPAFDELRDLAEHCSDKLLWQVLLTCVSEPSLRARIDRSRLTRQDLRNMYLHSAQQAKSILQVTDAEASNKYGILNEFLAYNALLRTTRVLPHVGSPREEASDFPRANHDLYLIDLGRAYNKRPYSIKSDDNSPTGSKHRPKPPVELLAVAPAMDLAMNVMEGKKARLLEEHEGDIEGYRQALQAAMVTFMAYETHEKGPTGPQLQVISIFGNLILKKLAIEPEDVFI